MSPHPRDSYDALTKSQAVVLVAVIHIHDKKGRVTVRELSARIGFTSTSTIHAHLRRLKDLGLVTWDDGTHGTLRPNVQLQRAGIA